MIKANKIFLTDCQVVCAAGETENLLKRLSVSPCESLTLSDTYLKNRPAYFGFLSIPKEYADLDTNKSLLSLYYLADKMKKTINRLIDQYGSKRIAVIIGTTTSGISAVETKPSIEKIDYHGNQELGVVAHHLAEYCKIQGPNLVVSTACTSGAKALGLAKQLIQSGVCDAAIAGASDTLSRITCQGFEALESYAQELCHPFQKGRDGINIGEGAALFSVEKGDHGIELAGFAETSDAWHESAPDPKGVGAIKAIEEAIHEAKLSTTDIDYINLHGTGTMQNDAMEAGVINKLFSNKTPASSTKSVMGHTLGAAGAVEAAILWLLLQEEKAVHLPPHHGVENLDPELAPIHLVCAKNSKPVNVVNALSTSFAFGGHNAAVVLRKRERTAC